MTVLALKLSGLHNGVSQLHEYVSRTMCQFLWPNVEVDEFPIDHNASMDALHASLNELGLDPSILGPSEDLAFISLLPHDRAGPSYNLVTLACFTGLLL